MDSRFLAFAGFALLLALSPGPTIAVITETAIEAGRRAALWTVLGVAMANTTLATAAAFGLSALVARVSWMLDAITVGGAAYLGFLGVRSLVRAWHGTRGRPSGGVPLPHIPSRPRVPRATSVGKGVATNLLNPSVALFYTMAVPQFIAPSDPFLVRFGLLCGAHIVLAALWHTVYALAVGGMSERMSRPRTRRAVEAATGLALLGFGVRFLWRLAG